MLRAVLFLQTVMLIPSAYGIPFPAIYLGLLDAFQFLNINVVEVFHFQVHPILYCATEQACVLSPVVFLAVCLQCRRMEFLRFVDNDGCRAVNYWGRFCDLRYSGSVRACTKAAKSHQAACDQTVPGVPLLCVSDVL